MLRTVYLKFLSDEHTFRDEYLGRCYAKAESLSRKPIGRYFAWHQMTPHIPERQVRMKSCNTREFARLQSQGAVPAL